MTQMIPTTEQRESAIRAKAFAGVEVLHFSTFWAPGYAALGIYRDREDGSLAVMYDCSDFAIRTPETPHEQYGYGPHREDNQAIWAESHLCGLPADVEALIARAAEEQRAYERTIA